MNKTHIVILLGIKLFFSLIALLLLTTVIHEGAHYVAAVIMKVPIAFFTWGAGQSSYLNTYTY